MSEKIFIDMSAEYRNSVGESCSTQCDFVVCGLEETFFIHYTDNSLTSQKGLDMPTLLDPSPTPLETTNFPPIDNIVEMKSERHSSYNLDESLAESSSTSVTDGDISEFLIFHKQEDPKLKFGCFVKLERMEAIESKTSAMPVVERPKIILKLVRQKNSSRSYQCHIVQNQIKDRFAIKNCSVSIKQLSTVDLLRHSSPGNKSNSDLSISTASNVTMDKHRARNNDTCNNALINRRAGTHNKVVKNAIIQSTAKKSKRVRSEASDLLPVAKRRRVRKVKPKNSQSLLTESNVQKFNALHPVSTLPKIHNNHPDQQAEDTNVVRLNPVDDDDDDVLTIYARSSWLNDSSDESVRSVKDNGKKFRIPKKSVPVEKPTTHCNQLNDVVPEKSTAKKPTTDRNRPNVVMPKKPKATPSVQKSADVSNRPKVRKPKQATTKSFADRSNIRMPEKLSTKASLKQQNVRMPEKVVSRAPLEKATVDFNRLNGRKPEKLVMDPRVRKPTESFKQENVRMPEKVVSRAPLETQTVSFNRSNDGATENLVIDAHVQKHTASFNQPNVRIPVMDAHVQKPTASFKQQSVRTSVMDAHLQKPTASFKQQNVRIPVIDADVQKRTASLNQPTVRIPVMDAHVQNPTTSFNQQNVRIPAMDAHVQNPTTSFNQRNGRLPVMEAVMEANVQKPTTSFNQQNVRIPAMDAHVQNPTTSFNQQNVRMPVMDALVQNPTTSFNQQNVRLPVMEAVMEAHVQRPTASFNQPIVRIPENEDSARSISNSPNRDRDPRSLKKRIFEGNRKEHCLPNGQMKHASTEEPSSDAVQEILSYIKRPINAISPLISPSNSPTIETELPESKPQPEVPSTSITVPQTETTTSSCIVPPGPKLKLTENFVIKVGLTGRNVEMKQPTTTTQPTPEICAPVDPNANRMSTSIDILRSTQILGLSTQNTGQQQLNSTPPTAVNTINQLSTTNLPFQSISVFGGSTKDIHQTLPSTQPLTLSQNSIQLPPTGQQLIDAKAILKIFQQPCLNFLQGMPCRRSNCRFKHVLPSEETISTELEGLSNDNIFHIYRKFVAKQLSTFSQYCGLFCRFFCVRKMVSAFKEFTEDSEKFNMYEYVESIANRFLSE